MPSSFAVKRVAPIGKEDKDHGARSQHSIDLADLRQWISQVLEQVTCDHEVLARVSQRREAIVIEIGDDVRFGERCACLDIGEEREILLGLPSVHELHGDPGIGDRHRMVARSELHAGAVEKTREQPAANWGSRQQVSGSWPALRSTAPYAAAGCPMGRAATMSSTLPGS